MWFHQLVAPSRATEAKQSNGSTMQFNAAWRQPIQSKWEAKAVKPETHTCECGLLWPSALSSESLVWIFCILLSSVFSICLSMSIKKTKNKIRIGFKHMCKISHFYLFFKSKFPGSPSSLLPLLASSISSLLNFGGLFFFSSYQIFRQSSSVRKQRYKSTKCKLKKHERERYLRHMNPN